MIFNKSSKIIAAVLTAALALSPVFVTPISATDGQEVEMEASSWRYQDGEIIEEDNVDLSEDYEDPLFEDYNAQMGSSMKEQTEESVPEETKDESAAVITPEENTNQGESVEVPDQTMEAEALTEEPIEAPATVEAPAEMQESAVIDEAPAAAETSAEPGVYAAATGKYWSWPYKDKTIVSDGGTLKGIDVSVWQGNINWAEVKRAGVDFAILRCGFGSNTKSNDDSRFDDNVKGCVRNGIPYGVYLYSYANTVAKANSEADHALRLLKDNNCRLQYPVYYDLEDERVDDASNATIRKIANTFCNKLSTNGYPAGVYANLSWWNKQLSGFNGYDKWVAQWSDRCTYSQSYSIWQCTSKASVSGISGSVDANLLMCSRNAMDQYMNLMRVTYSFQTIDGKTYLVGSDGSIIRNTFFRYGAYLYGFDPDGVMAYGKSFWIGNKGYILDSQGRAYINKSKTKKKASYYAKAGSGKKGTLKKGRSFYVLRTSGKWSQMANGYWVKTSLTKKTSVYPTITPSTKTNYKAKLKKKTVSRSGPSNSYIKKKTFKKNRKVTVIGTYGSWSKISSGQWLPSSRLKR